MQAVCSAAVSSAVGRCQDLGFPSGQEPTDMKRAHLASGAGNMAGLNYYKVGSAVLNS